MPDAQLLVARHYGYGIHIELIQYIEGAARARQADPNMASAAHVCFEVSSMEETWNRLLAAGATARGETADVSSGVMQGVKAGYLRDPSGIIIELIELPQSRR